MLKTSLSRQTRQAIGSLLLLGGAESIRAADPELAELRAQLAQLQARIDALEAQRALALAAPSPAAARLEAPHSAPVSAEKAKAKAEISGRMHIDVYSFQQDQRPVVSGSEFRRLRLGVAGDLGNWNYELAYEMGGDGGADGVRDALLAREWENARFVIGQFKPFRSMAELTSSNDMVVQERPFSSGTGFFNERQWQQGIGWQQFGPAQTLSVALSSLRSVGSARNEGAGLSARATWAPLSDASQTVHLGSWLSVERAGEGTPAFVVNVPYAGRRGPRDIVATAAAARGKLDAIGLEAAWQRGGWLLQSELSSARLRDRLGPSTRLDSGYLQLSWLLRGQRPYVATDGVFDTPADIGSGAWELTTRLDTLRRDAPTAERWRSAVVGVNYHANENLSWLLNYTAGASSLDDDRTRQWALRTLLRF